MKRNVFFEGFRDGIPIGLGYFAVAFSLGIVAKNAGLTPLQGFIASFLNIASAGENALFKAIQSSAKVFEIALISIVINARYFLMSCSLSQRFANDTPFYHRLLVGFGITDEIFGISIARGKNVEPLYNYGALLFAVPMWSIATSLGILAGTYLPVRIVSALSVALYGMFIAIIIPPAKRNPVIAISVLSGFVLSYGFSVLPHLKNLSEGNRTIILTILIASIAAVIKPLPKEPSEACKQETSENE